MSEIPELLPCPFCGSPAVGPTDRASVYCSNLDCAVHPEASAFNKALAIEAWNRRSRDATAVKMATALKRVHGHAITGQEATLDMPVVVRDLLTSIAQIAREALNRERGMSQSKEWYERKAREEVGDPTTGPSEEDTLSAIAFAALPKWAQDEITALRQAGDRLSYAAQTSGGTAGRDEGLVTAIDDWAKVRGLQP